MGWQRGQASFSCKLKETRYNRHMNDINVNESDKLALCNTTPVYNASLFSWIGNSGIADCSDLGADVFGDLPFKPFDFDTKHSGLILHNPKKGTSKLFCLVKTLTYSDDQEVTGWSLRDIDNKVEIIILND